MVSNGMPCFRFYYKKIQSLSKKHFYITFGGCFEKVSPIFGHNLKL
jgi:hypothetical protein